MSENAPGPASILARALNWLPGGDRLDSWINVVTGLGGRRDKSRSALVSDFARLTLPELDALYHGDDLPAKIVNALPEEAMRLGWTTGTPKLDSALETWRAQQNFLDAWIWGRLYGLGGIVIGTGPRLGPPTLPLRTRDIARGDLKYLLVVDGQDLTVASRVTDPLDRQYGEPATYRINAAGLASMGAPAREGLAHGAEIHASRLILFGGARTSERQRLRNYGRDLSVLQRCQDVLRDTDQSWRSIMALIQDLSQAVFKIDGLIELVADGKSDVALQRMQIVDMARSVARAVVIDSKTESYEHTGAANVTGVDPLLVRVFQRLASAAEMPLTVLMGVSPAGMNATGESDLRIWYASAEKARVLVSPQAVRLTQIVAQSEGCAREWSGKITWPALWTPTELEAAQLENAQADADVKRIQSGVLSSAEVALIRYGGQTAEDVVDLAARQAEIDPTSQDPADTGPEIESGSIWIDTQDGHRLEVTGRSGGNVYFLDLDYENPARQWKWREATFLERARQSGQPAPAPALPAAPAAPPDPAAP